MKPFVSILIPCYNGGPWLRQSIQSALDQTYTNKEVIVFDDGSKDDSLEIMRSFGERIRHETGPNCGGNATRNRLLRLARGEWLSFLDADDYLLPQKVEKQIELVKRDPALDLVYSPTYEYYPDTDSKYVEPIIDDDVYANYVRWGLFTTNGVLWRKVAIEEVGGWGESQPFCQEHELVLRLILAGKQFGLVPEAMSVNRIQYANSVSRRDPFKVLTRKLFLCNELENYLVSKGLMTETRRLALAHTRYQAARSAYRWDRQFACQVASKARANVPIYRCHGIKLTYRVAFQIFGFRLAEIVANWFRRMARSEDSLAQGSSIKCTK